MERQLSRLAVAHVLLIVYAVLSAAVFLKMRYGTASPDFVGDAPHGPYTLRIKEFGFCLLLIPAVWSFYSFWRMRKPDADTETFSGLYLSGVVIAIGLAVFGMSTGAVMVGPVIQVKQTPPPSLIRSNADYINRTEQP
jgi:hypothetical protein